MRLGSVLVTMVITCEKARKMVCGVCTRKGKLRPMSATALSLVKKHHYKDYDTEFFPSVICANCNVSLFHMEKKIKAGEIPIRRPPDINYEDKKSPRVTRSSSSQVCGCFWCKVAKMNGREYDEHSKSVRPPPVKPPSPEVIKICSRCKGRIHPGVSHKCNKTETNKNVQKIVRDSCEDGGKKAVSGLINSICEDEGVNKWSGSLTLPSGSKEKVINMGEKPPQPQVSIDDMVSLGMSRHWSDEDVMAVATAIRRKFGRKSVESGLSESLPNLKKTVKDFFELKIVDTLYTNKKKKIRRIEPKYLVVALEIIDLVEKILLERHIDPRDAELQVGLDDGAGLLKVSVFSIIIEFY